MVLLEDDDDICWNSDDEREIEAYGAPLSPSSFQISAAVTGREQDASMVGSSGTKLMDRFLRMGFPEKLVFEAIQENGEENEDAILETLLRESPSSSSPADSSNGSKVIDHFVGMGFSKEMVAKVIQEIGEEKTDSILETLLTYSAIEEPAEDQPTLDSDAEFEGSFLDEFSDIDSCESEVNVKIEPDEDDTVSSLVKMGYTSIEAAKAIERCGPDATVEMLTDFICAAQMAREADALFPDEESKPNLLNNKLKKRSYLDRDLQRKKQRMITSEDDEILSLPNPMIGFGLPGDIPRKIHRKIPAGPPYFYYENVALAPKGVWQTISRCLYDIEPEFVDSKHFCAAARKRGYVHNLPIEGRFPLLPIPPQTIHDAIPITKRFWPRWDPRDKLNCLQTAYGSAKLTERIRKAVEQYDGDPPEKIQKWVMYECRKWNLVWVGKNKVAPLEPDEVESLLGFPKNHTRGGGISRTDRYKSLGNSFQVDTVAFHLSVLKEKFPKGLNMLSLFSGIGGAEVALYRLGVPLKNVVSVEISEVNRGIMKCWWEQTGQKGMLIDIDDVQKVTAERLEHLMSVVGGFDLVVGGSPCNNLAGSNRHHRDGLEGRESSLFYDYCRILEVVKNLTAAGAN
ncbi:unnamed protein product [Linum trigynum]|uniref:DNA (cytosine-5-)-methyltransferase n=1 Tax=Linum trigynum TaxID=586398 RepID=A0AAV2F0G7_9ROSI